MDKYQKPDFVTSVLAGAVIVLGVILFHFALMPLSDWLGWTYATVRAAVMLPIALLVVVILRKSVRKRVTSNRLGSNSSGDDN